MSDHTSHKLWGGRFSIPTAAALEALNRSIGTDYRLWPFDVRLSQAWAVALWGAGVLTLEESKQIERGLSRVAERLGKGVDPLPSDEDVHTLIDRLLHEEVGDVASKLHTGRSRNDQVATPGLSIEDARDSEVSARALQKGCSTREGLQELDAGVTHLQRARRLPRRMALSHFGRERDRERSERRTVGGVLQLDHGAVEGCAFPFRACASGSWIQRSFQNSSMPWVIAIRRQLLFAVP